MANFQVDNPTANQILVYDEVTKSFINVDPSITGGDAPTGKNLVSGGNNIYKDTVNDVLRFKSLTGGNGISLINNTNSIDIVFDGDASSISGHTIDDILLKENNLSDVDPIEVRSNLEVYGKDESHDTFMETNASNIPDRDNEYDLGSNGRRYADIFAKTFHGTATNSLVANQLDRNSATDNQMLVWRDNVNRWVPEDQTRYTISSAIDFDTSNLRDRSIIRYNANINKWEAESFELGENDQGSLADIENLGTGFTIYRDLSGLVANFRSIRAGRKINLRYNFDDTEIVIDSDAPNTTDDLPEGDSNKYFTYSNFLVSVEDTNVRSMKDVQAGIPSVNQGLVWNGNQFVFRNMTFDVTSTDDISEGVNNKYYTEQRVVDVIDQYFINANLGLNQLSDVNATEATDHALIFRNNQWESVEFTVNNLVDYNVNNIQNNDILVWDSGTNRYVNRPVPQNLFDLNETSDSEHFTDSSFSNKISNVTTDDISEGSNNLYFDSVKLINELNSIGIEELSNVNLSGIGDSDILTWDQANSTFKPQTISSFGGGVTNIFELSNVNSDIITVNDNDILRWNDTNSAFETSPLTVDVFDVDGINLTYVSADDMLVYNGTEFITEPKLPYELTTINYGEYLVWDGSKFQNSGALGIGGVNDVNFSQLNDVDVTGISDGETIVWNNSVGKYVPAPSASSLTLNDLNNVVATSPSTNDVLSYNGTEYTLRNVPEFSVSGSSNNDMLIYDGTDYTNRNIKDVLSFPNTNAREGDVLVFNATTGLYEYKKFMLNQLINVNDTNIEDGYGYAWSALDGEYVAKKFAQFLSELDEDSDSQHFNDTTFNNKVSSLTTDDIAEGTTNLYLNDASVLAVLQSSNIYDLSDVQVTGLSDGDILTWNNTSGEFTNTDLNSAIDSLNKSLFDFTELVGVDGTITNNQVLIWDSTNSKFSTKSMETLNDLNDVTLSTPNNGQILAYDNGVFVNVDNFPYTLTTTTLNQIISWDGQRFVNKDLTQVINDVDFKIMDLPDVNITDTNIDSQILLWDSGNQAFNGTTLTIDFLNDVTINTLSDGDVLVWSESNNTFSNELLSIDNISGINSTTPDEGDILAWDVSNQEYINKKNRLLELDNFSSITAFTKGEVLIYDDVSSDFELRLLTVDDLSDVNLTGIQNNDVLSWDGTQFVATSGIPANIDYTTIASDSVLVWDDINNTFVDSLLTLSLFDNVSNTPPNEFTKLLVWNNTDSEYQNTRNVDSITISLSDISSSTVTNTIFREGNSKQITTVETGQVDGLSDAIDTTIRLIKETTHVIVSNDDTLYVVPPFYTGDTLPDDNLYYSRIVVIENPSDYTVDLVMSSDGGTAGTLEPLSNINLNGYSYLEFFSYDMVNWKYRDVSQTSIYTPEFDITNGQTDDVLSIDINGAFVNRNVKDILDLENTNPSDKQIYRYSTVDGKFMLTDVTIDIIDDIIITAGTEGDVLSLDSLGNVVNENVYDLINFNESTPSEGHVYIYDSVNQYFTNRSLSIEDISEFNSIVDDKLITFNSGSVVYTDVKELLDFDDTVTPVDNMVYMYDQTTSVFTLQNIDISVIDNVNLTGTDDNVLVVNAGTINNKSVYDIINFDNATPTDGQTYVYDSNSSIFTLKDFAFSSLNDIATLTKNENDLLSFDVNGDVVTTNVYDLLRFENTTSSDLDVYIFNSTSGLFELRNITFDDFSGINSVGITNNQVLAWDETNSEYVPYTLKEDISELSGIDVSTITDNQVLTWDATSSTLTPYTLKERLGELTNVAVDTIVDGQVIAWNETNSEYVPYTLKEDITELSGIDVSTITDNQVLVWENATSVLIPYTLKEEVSLLSDVNVSGITNSQVLSWDTTNSEFIPYSLKEQLSELSDVDVTGIADGNVLSWNITNNAFEVYDLKENINLLDGVNTTDIVDSQVLTWDNTNSEFIPYTLKEELSALNDVNISTISDDDILVWDEINSEFVNDNLSERLENSDKIKSLNVVTTESVDLSLAKYTQLEPTVNSTYTLSDITILTDTVFECRIYLVNTTDVDITFASQSGTIEYVGTAPTVADLYGTHFIDVVSFDGINWILNISSTIA